MPHSRSGFVSRDVEDYDSFGRRRVRPVRTYMERKGFILRPKFIFIDGRTGATMHSQSHREEVLYNAQQNTPALSSYFELMDKIVPDFLQALSSSEDPRHSRPSEVVPSRLNARPSLRSNAGARQPDGVHAVMGVPELVVLAIIAAVIWIGWIRGRL